MIKLHFERFEDVYNWYDKEFERLNSLFFAILILTGYFSTVLAGPIKIINTEVHIYTLVRYVVATSSINSIRSLNTQVSYCIQAIFGCLVVKCNKKLKYPCRLIAYTRTRGYLISKCNKELEYLSPYCTQPIYVVVALPLGAVRSLITNVPYCHVEEYVVCAGVIHMRKFSNQVPFTTDKDYVPYFSSVVIIR